VGGRDLADQRLHLPRLEVAALAADLADAVAQAVDRAQHQVDDRAVERDAVIAHQPDQILGDVGQLLDRDQLQEPGVALDRVQAAVQPVDLVLAAGRVFEDQERALDRGERLARVVGELAPDAVVVELHDHRPSGRSTGARRRRSGAQARRGRGGAAVGQKPPKPRSSRSSGRIARGSPWPFLPWWPLVPLLPARGGAAAAAGASPWARSIAMICSSTCGVTPAGIIAACAASPTW
jgi:hypothetical protein